MTILMDGKALAKQIRGDLKIEVSSCLAKGFRAPRLAMILVGNDPASAIYVRSKAKVAEEIGIAHELLQLPADVPQELLLDAIRSFNEREDVDAVLPQLPLPSHLQSFSILSELKTEKDVDGLTPKNQGLLLWNQGAILPCTPRGIMELLLHYQVPVRGKRAVVIGRSLLVGRSIALLLDQSGATVTTIHSATPSPEGLCRDADIVVAAAGVAGLVRATWLKSGCTVIDVGIHRVESTQSLVGDVLASEAMGRAAFLTPVPGGVGPMTMAMLMRNTVDLYLRSEVKRLAR